jgi:hypothetical protein
LTISSKCEAVCAVGEIGEMGEIAIGVQKHVSMHSTLMHAHARSWMALDGIASMHAQCMPMPRSGNTRTHAHAHQSVQMRGLLECTAHKPTTVNGHMVLVFALSEFKVGAAPPHPPNRARCRDRSRQ